MPMMHGFELLRDQYIPELNTRVRYYRHVKTGAELLSLENDDENKVFSINFRTPPSDSTGVPHIMEHAVLGGSRKYPVKEPFVELLKGSLKTFVNAFTYPDKTCYPVASQNAKDFYNLIDVYLDAVFYPLIPLHTLQQEGWHYELDKVEDPLVYKGIVFNEMKGSFSSPDNLLGLKSQQLLFPDTSYAFVSGGDPEKIPDLTYQQFKDFHARYYHPSNSRIFFYGDDDPETRLKILDEYLRDFEKIPVDSQVKLQTAFAESRRVIVPYDAGDEADSDQAGENGGRLNKKARISVNWLLPEIGDAELSLGLNILEHILVETPASPLRKALIDSGIGEDLTQSGVADYLRQLFFTVGMKGITLDDAGKVEALIIDTLHRLVVEGIDADMVAASLNTIEFRLRENNTGSFPRGISLMLRSLTTWLHDGDPIAPLAFETPLKQVKQRVESGDRYFEGLIRDLILGNPHRATVILKPDSEYGKLRDAAERDRLDQARAAMSEADLQAIIENTRQLKILQETPDTPEALATIPTLKTSDLDKHNKLIPLDVLTLSGSQVLYHELFTNGILYLDIGLNIKALPEEYVPFVPLFGRALLEMGTDRDDYVRLSQRIGRTTGGIDSTTFIANVQGTQNSTAWLLLRGKATADHESDLLVILSDIFSTARLDDKERFRQIVLEEKASLEARLVPMGNWFVDTRLRAHQNEAGWVAEHVGGISYLFFIRELVNEIEKDWAGVLEKIESVRRSLISCNAMIANVTWDANNWKRFQPKLSDFLKSMPSSELPEIRWKPKLLSGNEGLTIPAQVNYVGKGANLYDLGYRLDGSVWVILNNLRTTWLWERVRVRGGAYGGSCVFDHRSGIFNFLSYRDPNLLQTLDIYDQTGQFLQELDLSQDELTKNIIGAIGAMDAYQLPDAKGYTSMQRYLSGETDQGRQRLRDQVLTTTQEDFKSFGEFLVNVKDNGIVAVLGSGEAISSAEASNPEWLKVLKVL